MRGLVAVLTLLPLVAGCLLPETPEPAPASSLRWSPERFSILPGESVWFEASSDGVPLHTRLFRPDTSDEPAWKSPVILVMSPYFAPESREDPNDPASRPTYFRYRWLIENFVPRGYTVAFQDVRGTGESGGCLEQTAKLSQQDGFDTIEWLGTQVWSNGKVGTIGKSYDAETQTGAAILAPPHLVTMVPISAVSGQYEYHFFDGVPYTLSGFMSTSSYATEEGMPNVTRREDATRVPERLGCAPEVILGASDPSGDWSPYWEAREIRKGVESIAASVLYVQGLQDWNVKPVAIRDWFDRIPTEKRAILGQWAHDYPEENRYRPEWSRADWRAIVHRWFDRWLLDIPNGILEDLPPVEVQDSAGVWRSEPQYPVADAVPLRLHLGPDGSLGPLPVKAGVPMRENEEAFLARFTGLPIPTVAPPIAPPGALVAFESAPLLRDLHVSGFPTVSMNFTVVDSLTRRTDPHFAFVLYDVAPNGEANWINRGYLSARHRDGVEHPASVPMGETLDYVVRFFPQETVIRQGHTLRLTVAGSDAWTQPEGSAWAGVLEDGVLSLPTIARNWGEVSRDVPYAEPRGA